MRRVCQKLPGRPYGVCVICCCFIVGVCIQPFLSSFFLRVRVIELIQQVVQLCTDVRLEVQRGKFKESEPSSGIPREG